MFLKKEDKKTALLELPTRKVAKIFNSRKMYTNAHKNKEYKDNT